MKNSTLHRSNLSSERMAVLAELKAQKKHLSDNSPGIYKRMNKQKELDVLWESFKLNQKEDKSPGMFILAGFIAGALSMFLMTAVISINSNNSFNEASINTPKAEKKFLRRKKSNIAIVPPDQTIQPTASASEIYTVQNGDTLEGIIIRFYGSFDLGKVEKIKAANNLRNPNALQIGQKLVIPLS